MADVLKHGLPFCGVLVCIWACGVAYAELPAPVTGKPGATQATVDDLTMTYGEQTALERRLARSVVVIHAELPSGHRLAQGKRVYDGAAVAIYASDVADILSPEFVVGDDRAEAGRAHSFFDDAYREASSPFAREARKTHDRQARRQYYLTTADWLTGAQKVEVSADNREIPAQVEYRDDAQNVAVLSTEQPAAVDPVAIYDFDANGKTLPGVAFLLLRPRSAYQRMTAHALSLVQYHTYATSNHMARNGYPMFTRKGEIVGLSVGPVPAHTQAYVVHSGLIDRALHPQKYDRTTTEHIEMHEK